MRRALLVLCVVLMVALAGCAGTNGSDADTAADAPSEDDVPGEEIDDSGTDDDDVDGNETDESDRSEDDGPPDDTGPGDDVAGELEIHHLDVGQADSTLVVTPDGETILVDTGDWRQDGQEVIDYLEANEIDRIDHLVATHAHADHIGGHAAVIEHFETQREGIGAVYDSGVATDTATYQNYLDAIEAHDVELFVVEEGNELPIEDPAVSATVLNPPEGDSGSDLHYNSVALAIEFGDFRYLTTGDAEEDAEQRMVDEWGDELDADVYQAGHHGSSTSSTTPFVNAVDPEVVVISSAYDSQYGHPHDEVLEDFAERGLDTYWTGVHGDVVVTTDGSEITVETTTDFSTNAADLLDEKPADDEDEATSAIAPPGVDGTAPPLAS